MKALVLLMTLLLTSVANASDINTTIGSGPSGSPFDPPTSGPVVTTGPKTPSPHTTPDNEYYARCGYQYGCNFLKGGAENRFRDEARAGAVQSRKSYEGSIAKIVDGVDADLASLRNGSDVMNSPEGKAAQGVMKAARDQHSLATSMRGATMEFVKVAETALQDALKFVMGVAIGEGEKKDYVLDKALADSMLKTRQSRALPEVFPSFGEMPSLTNNYSDDPSQNYDELQERAKAYQDAGDPSAAADLTAMAGRLKSFQGGESLEQISPSSEALARFPALADVRQDNFQGYETTLIANEFAGLDSDLASFYGESLVNQLVSLRAAASGRFLSAAEFSWNVARNLATNRPFQMSVLKATGSAAWDNVTGIYHLIRHPIDSVAAIGSALWHLGATYRAIKAALSRAVDDLGTCDEGTDACAKVMGRISGDIAFGMATGGASKGMSALQASGKLEVVVEGLARMGMSVVSKAKKLEMSAAQFERVLAKAEGAVACGVACGGEVLELANQSLQKMEDLGLKSETAVLKIESTLDSAKAMGMSKLADIDAWTTAITDLSDSRLAKVLTESSSTMPKKIAQSISPDVVKFSQSTVNGAAEIVDSMKANGWIGDAIDVVKISDGTMITVDNTRVLAASRAGIEIQAMVRSGSEILPKDMIERFTNSVGVSQTWEDAVKYRIMNQNKTWSRQYPNGSYIIRSLD
ncbi:MAG: hypothetical protein H7318_14845 [Oligoflexus sp.]|nr:hypothetical protein [Oligoflexus sp.]